MNQPAINIKRPTKEEVELFRRIMQGPGVFNMQLWWMNLSKAVVVSEGIALRIKRFTWNSSNYRGSMPLIPHQLHLLILSGRDFYLNRLYIFPGTRPREFRIGQEIEHFWLIA